MTILNRRQILGIIAILIVLGTLFYSQYLSNKISADERQKVDTWIQAQRTISLSNDKHSLELASKIAHENEDIPILETNEHDQITGNYLNIDSASIATDPLFLSKQLKKFKALHPPILLVLADSPYQANKYYYGRSVLQEQVRYYPIVQLLIIALFITLMIILMRTSNRNTQNQLWVGMAKETAHQLGTPVSSLHAWIEVLKEKDGIQPIASEIEKDVQRLQLVSDRFGKIGSVPVREEKDLARQINAVIDYMKKRAGTHVHIQLHEPDNQIIAKISPPLFDWVIENLVKNALDAIEGKGMIKIDLHQKELQIIIDVTDNGKGIHKNQLKKLFEPGFTTKKRGWGIGLALTKRIIEQYHNGNIFVKWSEIGKGTTFRIMLPSIKDNGELKIENGNY